MTSDIIMKSSMSKSYVVWRHNVHRIVSSSLLLSADFTLGPTQTWFVHGPQWICEPMCLPTIQIWLLYPAYISYFSVGGGGETRIGRTRRKGKKTITANCMRVSLIKRHAECPILCTIKQIQWKRLTSIASSLMSMNLLYITSFDVWSS